MPQHSENDLQNDVDKIPVLSNEKERIEALYSYHILDTVEEKDFDDLTMLASAICQTPIALVSLVDEDRQWFKSHKGLPATETPKEYSFCAHAIASDDSIMVINDAAKDQRFADNPLVTGEPHIAFYAGVPLINEDGFALGSLCVIDSKVRELNNEQVNALMILAQQVVDKLELRRKMIEMQDMNRKLFESEEHFKNLISQSPVAIATLKGREMIIDAANEMILKIWGKDSGIIGKPLHIALPELEGQPFLQLLDDVYITGSPYYGYEVKINLYHKTDLVDMFVNFVYHPIKDNVGNTAGIMVVAIDVSDQVKARTAVEEINQRLEVALAAGELGSYDVNLITGQMQCTEQCKKNFGLDASAIFNFADLFNSILPEFRSYVKQQVDESIVNNTVYHATYQAQWPDKSIHWISAHGKPRYDNEGRATHMIGVTLDITKNKNQEQRKDDFLNIASHELKTPLTSLKGSLQLLDALKHDPFSPFHTQLIDQANRGMKKIDLLVQELLDVNMLKEGQLKLNKTYFSIADLLKNCCNHIEITKSHELIYKGEKNLVIYADEHRIDQVIVNFVNNAVKYAPNSRAITLDVTKENNCAKISVTDDGPGIAKEKIPFIFDRYYRVEHSGNGGTGLGLGLYISTEIIKRHGGEIGVVSEQGKGSCFWFTIPLQL